MGKQLNSKKKRKIDKQLKSEGVRTAAVNSETSEKRYLKLSYQNGTRVRCKSRHHAPSFDSL